MRGIRTKIGQGGRVVIPAEFREALDLNVGDTIFMYLEDGQIRIQSPSETVRRAQQLLRCYVPEGRSLVDELIAERRAEAARE